MFFQYGLDKRYSQVGASGPNYTHQTPAQSVGSDFTTHGIGPVAVSGLLPNALYHVRLVATNTAGTAFGQDVTFTTALAPAPGAPTLGKTFNIAPVSGLVFVLINGHLVPLTQVEQIPSGTVIDARQGTFELVIDAGGGPARDAAAKGRIQRGDFGGAVVRIHQATRGANRGLTTVMMVESAFKGAPGQAICKAPAADAHAAKVSSKTIQLLHASAHGKFSTSGRYSAATVRGTKWTMAARCDGTLTHDLTDSVVVTDFIRHKTIMLHAGQSYLRAGAKKEVAAWPVRARKFDSTGIRRWYFKASWSPRSENRYADMQGRVRDGPALGGTLGEDCSRPAADVAPDPWDGPSAALCSPPRRPLPPDRQCSLTGR